MADTTVLNEGCAPRSCNVPSYLEKLVEAVQAELKDDINEYDLAIVLMFTFMVETGFTPVDTEGLDPATAPSYGNGFNLRKLSAMKAMPNHWRSIDGSNYRIHFVLHPYPEFSCELLAVRTDTTMVDNLIVNIVVNNREKADNHCICVHPSRTIRRCRGEAIPEMFKNLTEMSTEVKDLMNPIRNVVLEEHGMLNPSLNGLPLEVKLKICEYLAVGGEWRAVSETSKNFNELADDSHLWQFYLERDISKFVGQHEGIERGEEVVDWKQEYKKRLLELKRLQCYQRNLWSSADFTLEESFSSSSFSSHWTISTDLLGHLDDDDISLDFNDMFALSGEFDEGHLDFMDDDEEDDDDLGFVDGGNGDGDNAVMQVVGQFDDAEEDVEMAALGLLAGEGQSAVVGEAVAVLAAAEVEEMGEVLMRMEIDEEEEGTSGK